VNGYGLCINQRAAARELRIRRRFSEYLGILATQKGHFAAADQSGLIFKKGMSF
jgi:hypothetical protein